MSRLWVFAQDLVEPGLRNLSTEEARHVASRRLRVGDELAVFDGRGRTASARLVCVARKAVQIEVDGIELAPPPSSDFGLATAIPKGERLSTMLQMWTQLGLEAWQPLICEDSAVRKLDIGSARLQRILIEACKVARRPWALRVLEPLAFADFLERRDQRRPLYYGDREGDQEGDGVVDRGEARAGLRSGFASGAGWVLIGPEAGFSASEIATLRRLDATALSFSEYNLRIETAAVAAVAAYNQFAVSRVKETHDVVG
jgi:16S rRNA (uracil1498-N3)-methyltransferase